MNLVSNIKRRDYKLEILNTSTLAFTASYRMLLHLASGHLMCSTVDRITK
jgi:hypothetical protein